MFLIARTKINEDVRLEADLRGPAGLKIDDTTVRVAGGVLVAKQGRRTLASTPVPDDRGWRHRTIDVRDGRLTAVLDGTYSVTTRGESGVLGVVGDTGSEVDNVSSGRLYKPVSKAVATPEPNRLLPAYSDDFGGNKLDAAWTFVRPDPAAGVAAGALNRPVQGADLTGTSNNAGVLLRDAPAGNWIAETKLTLDLGAETVRNFQQAGLIAYVDDDRFVRLSAVAIWNTRQVEFGLEMPFGIGPGAGSGRCPRTPRPGSGWSRTAARHRPWPHRSTTTLRPFPALVCHWNAPLAHQGPHSAGFRYLVFH